LILISATRKVVDFDSEKRILSGWRKNYKLSSPDLSNAAMHELMQSFIPKKSPLEKYREQKAAISAMLAAGDITGDVANQLIEKLNNELLSSNLI
jgi:hypothetical protein